MAVVMKGRGRVNAFRFIHMWQPSRACVLAYTSAGEFGNTAVIGYVPFPQVPDVSLLDVAARHGPERLYGRPPGEPRQFPEASWLICTGSGARLINKPGSMNLPEADWSLEVDSSIDLGRTMYTHEKLRVGRFTFSNPDFMKRAFELLCPSDIKEMSEEDQPAHSN